ncbi:MAG TPA: nitric-oxide reductase large subunit, partial [Campylobacterales bacterium]|nr:nitric-oxide reductase large subunit [Campylobacterales bacterium]
AWMAFLGAGVWGFLHTLAPVNYFTHGTQLTAAHGHLAFFGAYAMIAMTITSYAMPIMRGRPNGNSLKAQKVEKLAFWLMVIGMLGITLALTVAGVMQILLQRWDDSTAISFMAAQIEMIPVYKVRLAFGLMFTAGLVAYFWSFFVGGELPGEAEKV